MALAAPLGRTRVPAAAGRPPSAASTRTVFRKRSPDWSGRSWKRGRSLTRLPGYPAAWEETLRKSHRLNFADPGSLPPEADASPSLTLDVAPLVGLATRQMSDATGLPLEAPEQTLINIGQSDQRQLVDRCPPTRRWAMPLAIGAASPLLWPCCRPPAMVGALRCGLRGPGAGRILGPGLRWRAAVLRKASGNGVADMFKSEFVGGGFRQFRAWVTGGRSLRARASGCQPCDHARFAGAGDAPQPVAWRHDLLSFPSDANCPAKAAFA